jgi:hypothetical protein
MEKRSCIVSCYMIIHPASPLSVPLLGASLTVAQLVRSLDAFSSEPRAAHMEIGSLKFGGPADNASGCVLGLLKWSIYTYSEPVQTRLDSQVAAMTPNQGCDALESVTCQALFVPCGGEVFHQRHVQKRALQLETKAALPCIVPSDLFKPLGFLFVFFDPLAQGLSKY